MPRQPCFEANGGYKLVRTVLLVNKMLNVHYVACVPIKETEMLVSELENKCGI